MDAIERPVSTGGAIRATHPRRRGDRPQCGAVTATGVLFDMAAIFENFVVVALRESLGLTHRQFPQGAERRRLRLAHEGITLKPDLSWWIDDTCVFVGDCKYKRAKVEGVPNADLYQLLAYATALKLPNGLLIYAAGEHPGGAYTVRNSDKSLTITTLDLAGSPTDALAQIDTLARQVKLMARATLITRPRHEAEIGRSQHLRHASCELRLHSRRRW